MQETKGVQFAPFSNYREFQHGNEPALGIGSARIPTKTKNGTRKVPLLPPENTRRNNAWSNEANALYIQAKQEVKQGINKPTKPRTQENAYVVGVKSQNRGVLNELTRRQRKQRRTRRRRQNHK